MKRSRLEREAMKNDDDDAYNEFRKAVSSLNPKLLQKDNLVKHFSKFDKVKAFVKNYNSQ